MYIVNCIIVLLTQWLRSSCVGASRRYGQHGWSPVLLKYTVTLDKHSILPIHAMSGCCLYAQMLTSDCVPLL